MESVQVPVNDLTHQVVVHVDIVGYQGWLVRLVIAKFLLRLACWIAGVGLQVNGSVDELRFN